MKKGKRINFLSSLKLLWNPSLRGKCQQWQEKNLMGVAFFLVVKKEEESLANCRNQFTMKFELLFSVNMLCIFSRSLFYSVCLFVCFWRREHTTHDQQNKSATPLESGIGIFIQDVHQLKTKTWAVCSGNNMISGAICHGTGNRTERNSIRSVIMRVIPNSFLPQ